MNVFLISFKDSGNAIRLNVILEETLENLFKDLVTKPDLSDLSYLSHVHKTIPSEYIRPHKIYNINIFDDFFS